MKNVIYVLVDHHGYIVYFNKKEKNLHRGAGEVHSLDIIPVRVSKNKAFYLEEGGVEVPLEFSLRKLSQSKHSLTYGISDGLFWACSDLKESVINFNRENISGWETFTLRKVCLPSNSIMSNHDLILLETEHKGKLTIQKSKNGILMDDRYYDLLENLSNIEDSISKRDVVLYRGLNFDRYFIFYPLVYYVCFGGDNQFNLLKQSLISLSRIGNYEGKICIITDRRNINDYIPPELSENVFIFISSANSREEMWRARYDIKNIEGIEVFQPILYLDTDVVCNEDIYKLLNKCIISEKISVGTENHPGVTIIPSTYDWAEGVGRSFFQKDNFLPSTRFGFNSGVIGFRNLSTIKLSFFLILRMMNIIIENRLSYPWSDQAVANYVLNKLQTVDDCSISKYIAVGTVSKVYNFENYEESPVLIHFWSTHSNERISVVSGFVEDRIRYRGRVFPAKHDPKD